MKNFVKQMWQRWWGKEETPAKVDVDPELVKYGEKVVGELIGKPANTPKLISATENVKLVEEADATEFIRVASEGRVDDSKQPITFRTGKPQGVKCGLPGCSVLTLHNGGYCCADHCREHRAQQKARKSA